MIPTTANTGTHRNLTIWAIITTTCPCSVVALVEHYQYCPTVDSPVIVSLSQKSLFERDG